MTNPLPCTSDELPQSKIKEALDLFLFANKLTCVMFSLNTNIHDTGTLLEWNLPLEYYEGGIPRQAK